jgi:hypothetical protein
VEGSRGGEPPENEPDLTPALKPACCPGYGAVHRLARWARSREYTDFGGVICYHPGDEKNCHRRMSGWIFNGIAILINFPVGAITVRILPELALL